MEVLPQPPDVYIHRVRVRFRVVAPDIVHQLLARKDPSGKRGHLVQQHEFLLRQRHALRTAADGQRIAFQHRFAEHLPVLVDHLRPAQKRPDAQDHFIDIDGLDHIIIAPGEEAHAHIVKGILRRDHQDGHIHPLVADRPHERVAVHLRHHDIGDQQVKIASLERFQRLESV